MASCNGLPFFYLTLPLRRRCLYGYVFGGWFYFMLRSQENSESGFLLFYYCGHERDARASVGGPEATSPDNVIFVFILFFIVKFLPQLYNPPLLRNLS